MNDSIKLKNIKKLQLDKDDVVVLQRDLITIEEAKELSKKIKRSILLVEDIDKIGVIGFKNIENESWSKKVEGKDIGVLILSDKEEVEEKYYTVCPHCNGKYAFDEKNGAGICDQYCGMEVADGEWKTIKEYNALPKQKFEDKIK